VEFFGMSAGDDRQTHDGVFVNPDETAGLAHAAALLQMLQDREGFLLGKFGAVQRRAFAFRETGLAGATGEDTAFFIGPISKANAQVVAATLAIVGTVGVLAAEVFQVVHDVSSRSEVHGKVDEQLQSA
jgi:hypothetical protein